MKNKIIELLHQKKRVGIGLMSGTALDGVEGVVAEISGSFLQTQINVLGFGRFSYPPELRQQLSILLEGKCVDASMICRLHRTLGTFWGKTAQQIFMHCGTAATKLDFVACHGQTVSHLPQENATWQIGDFGCVAAHTGCITIGDFRTSDSAYGGTGSPIVPYAEFVLISHPCKNRVLLNIGGISSVTVLPKGQNEKEVLNFDLGPGCVLIDGLVNLLSGGTQTFDFNGFMAERGKIQKKWLDELLNRDAFLILPPPKTTIRDHYNTTLAKKLLSQGHSRRFCDEDIVATITAYTVNCIIDQLKRFVFSRFSVDELIVSGGGANNQFLIRLLSSQLPLPISPWKKLGLTFSAAEKESVAMVVLGNEFLNSHYNNLPALTGASGRVIMGKLAQPSDWVL